MNIENEHCVADFRDFLVESIYLQVRVICAPKTTIRIAFQ